MEETQRRVKNAVDDLIDNLDRDILRDKQRKAFLCSADCCNSTGSRTTIETCVDSCNKLLLLQSACIHILLNKNIQVINQCRKLILFWKLN